MRLMTENVSSATEREIAQQPEVWLRIAALMVRERARLDKFLAPLLGNPDLRIVLSGAGTSSFIGSCLAPALSWHLQRRVESVATTDLVTGPQLHLHRNIPTLLVSFARSGNSPESVAAIDLAEQALIDPSHLIITCNSDGALARRASIVGSALTLLLPDETNDRGFAMTSSFSSMLLTATLAFGVLTPDVVPRLSSAAAAVMNPADALARRLAKRHFERVVFLGSNELRGLAAEAALKLLELTDGRTIAMSESVLGFRHGPKTVINDHTLIVLLLSNDAYTRAYDRDLLAELSRDGNAGAIIALGAPSQILGGIERLDFPGLDGARDLEVALLDIVFAQLLALRQSLEFGLTPDRPNIAGVVNRVVQGVRIYRWPEDHADVSRR
jgi:tagatose-6-phosphate ketose/aldose isomerase